MTSEGYRHIKHIGSRAIEEGEYFPDTRNRVDVHFLDGGVRWELRCAPAPEWFLELSPYSYARSYCYLQICNFINSLEGCRFPSINTERDGSVVLHFYAADNVEVDAPLLLAIDEMLEAKLYTLEPTQEEQS